MGLASTRTGTPALRAFKSPKALVDELTTSAIHAKVFPSSWDESPNVRQMQGRANIQNFAVIESETNEGTLFLNLTTWGPDREKLFRENLRISM